MPKMEVVGLTLNVASDDMFLPALFGLAKSFLGFVGSIMIATVLGQGALLENPEACSKGLTPAERSGAVAAWLIMVLFVFCFATFAAMFYVSTRGTPCEPERRGAMPALILAMALLYVGEIAAAVWTSMLASSWPTDELDAACADVLEQKLVAVGLGAALVWFDVALFFMWAFLFQHQYQPSRTERLQLGDFDRSAVEWERCFRFWCRILRYLTCNMFGFVTAGEDADETYQCVAEVFNSWFKGTGLSLTDLLAAMILIRADQKATQASALRYSRYDDPASAYVPGAKSRKKKFNVLDTSVRAMATAKVEDVADDEDLESGPLDDRDGETGEGMRGEGPHSPIETQGPPSEEAFAQFRKHYDFIPYMIALYGWKLVLYSTSVRLKPLTGISKVLKLPGLRKQAEVRGDGDNCCGCASQALLGETALDPESVIYATFSSVAIKRDSSVQIPHAVMVDHAKRAVVVAMRGTLSLQDLMTDAMLEPTSLGTAGKAWGFDGSRHHAHEGMLKVAMRIRGTLEKNQVLHRLLGVAPRSYEQTYVPDIRSAVEPVVDVDLDSLPDCSGYELVVLGHSLGAGVASLVTLLLRPTFPDAKCLAYAGPGCVMSYDLAEQSKEWCTNLFLGSDIVPRLSWEALTGLRERVFDVLYRARVSKARILRGALSNESADTLLYEPYEVPQTPGRLALKARAEEISNRRRSRRVDQILMYTPGVIIHLAKVETVYHRGIFTRRKERIFEPHWVLDRRALGDPLLSTRSLLDHFPDLIPEACAQILSRYGRESEVAATDL